MSYKVFWLIEGRVLYFQASGAITTEDIQLSNAEVLHYLDQATAPRLHMIMDNRFVVGTVPVKEFKKAVTVFHHPRYGWLVTVGTGNAFINMIEQAIASLFRLRFRSYTSLSDALDFLQEVDESLPDLHPFYDFNPEPIA